MTTNFERDRRSSDRRDSPYEIGGRPVSGGRRATDYYAAVEERTGGDWKMVLLGAALLWFGYSGLQLFAGQGVPLQAWWTPRRPALTPQISGTAQRSAVQAPTSQPVESVPSVGQAAAITVSASQSSDVLPNTSAGGDRATADLHFQAARAALREGDDVAALRSLQLAIDSAPTWDAPEIALGHYSFGQGDMPEARRVWRGVLAAHPGSAGARAGLALIAQREGDTQTALSLWREALQLDPRYGNDGWRLDHEQWSDDAQLLARELAKVP